MSYMQSIPRSDKAGIGSKMSHLVGNDLIFCSRKKSISNIQGQRGIRLMNSIQAKNQCLKQFKTMARINRNLQNAFPQNFFQTSKTQRAKKGQIQNGKSCKQNIEQINCEQKHQKITPLGDNVSASMYPKESRPITDCFDKKLQNNTRVNIFKVKKLTQCRTSIEKQNGLRQITDKQKNVALPQTAQSLGNCEQDDLFNITFGNGINKHISLNKSIMVNGNLSGLKMKKIISLEFRANENKLQMRKSQGTRKLSRKLNTLQKSEVISQRKINFNNEKQNHQNRLTENTFQKIKLDIDQIIDKKTLVLPKMRHLMSQNAKKQRFSKLTKLIF